MSHMSVKTGVSSSLKRQKQILFFLEQGNGFPIGFGVLCVLHFQHNECNHNMQVVLVVQNRNPWHVVIANKACVAGLWRTRKNIGECANQHPSLSRKSNVCRLLDCSRPRLIRIGDVSAFRLVLHKIRRKQQTFLPRFREDRKSLFFLWRFELCSFWISPFGLQGVFCSLWKPFFYQSPPLHSTNEKFSSVAQCLLSFPTPAPK